MSQKNNETVLGIDLGTSNSVAAVYVGGDCHVIADSKGKTVQPSVVSFHPNEKVLVGPSAKKRRLVDPQNTLFSVKRLMGVQANSGRASSFIKKLPYKVTEGPKKQPVLHVRGHRLTPPQVSALILKHMKNLSQKQLGEDLSKAVITVPANFNDAQRNATKAAGKLAGLDVIRIINEPTAAALAYGHSQGLATQVLLYDFGGGTFDVTLLRITGEIFEVLATAGDTQLGGDDIDERLMDAIVEDFMRTHRYDLSHNEIAMLRIRSVAEKIKCQLSESGQSSVEIKELAYGPGGKPLDLSFQLTREKLEFLMADLVERTLEICDEAFALADLTPKDIDDVVLVGGSTRIPLVRKEVATYFGRHPQSRINPDEVVAVGAAIQGAALTEKSIRYSGPLALLLDVTPMSLCIGTVGGFATQVIPRNSQLPTEQTRIFSTSADYQDSVSIRVCQGQHRRFDDNIYLGELTMEGLRPALRGEVRVEVTFEINTDGILQVHARDPDTNTQQTARMQTVGTPTEGDLDALEEELPLVDDRQSPPLSEETQLPAADGGDG